MEFKKLTLDCLELIKPYFTENANRVCDCTVGGTFIWRDYHKTEYAIEDGGLYLKVAYPELAFTPPRGIAHTKESFERIFDYCLENAIPTKMFAVSEPTMHEIMAIYPNSTAVTDRSWSDYLYSSGDITSLAGRKYSGQRNHINRFMREYPNWKFERITEDNIPEVREFYEKYANEHLKDSLAYLEGNRKALEVLDNFSDYGLFGGVLYADGVIVGESLGEIVGDTLFVHTEKANTTFHGSYPMLVNRFAEMFVCEGIEFINREEDDGVEGLRTSKLSYHPVDLLHKYAIELRM